MIKFDPLFFKICLILGSLPLWQGTSQAQSLPNLAQETGRFWGFLARVEKLQKKGQGLSALQALEQEGSHWRGLIDQVRKQGFATEAEKIPIRDYTYLAYAGYFSAMRCLYTNGPLVNGSLPKDAINLLDQAVQRANRLGSYRDRMMVHFSRAEALSILPKNLIESDKMLQDALTSFSLAKHILPVPERAIFHSLYARTLWLQGQQKEAKKEMRTIGRLYGLHVAKAAFQQSQKHQTCNLSH